MNPATLAYPTAGVAKRFAALIYDLLLLIAVSLAYGGLVLAFQMQVLEVELQPGQRADMGLAGFMGLLVVLVGFYCFFWRRFGQTLGMKAWKLVLTNSEGYRPSLKQCVVRCLVAVVSFAALGLGYFWRWVDADKLTWHDRASGTRVLQIRKPPNPDSAGTPE
ncbi:MAG TPA: RDD family protein [Cellvibrionaceae bacterium]